MSDLSVLRLNLLRGGYGLIAIGLGILIWPTILDPATTWELQRGVVVSMLGAMGLLSILGLRHPLKMLPLLLFEVTWKAIWLLRIAPPLALAGKLDPATMSVLQNCLVVVIVIAVIPWDHVVARYVLAPGEPWLRPRAPKIPAQVG